VEDQRRKRIQSINAEDDTVTFNYKDYTDAGLQKQMTLTAHEFIRRFEQHILPERFTKISTYGYLSNRNLHQRINDILKKMKLPLHKGLVKIPLQIRMLEQFGINIAECPCCKNKTCNWLKYFIPGNIPGMDDNYRWQ
jgi:Putative transposase